MMNRFVFFLTLSAFTVACSAQDVALTSDKQKFSYAIGYNIGQKMKQDSIDLDDAAFAQAIRDAAGGTPSRMTAEETQAVIAAFQQKRQEEMTRAADENLKKGQEWLAANKKKRGVVSLPSGLQYKIVKTGKGEKPKATDTVIAHYRGTLTNGKEFDSSIGRGEPATFPLGGVIKGWQEALQLMPVGSKWEVFIPAELAYGAHGAGGAIGPNEALVFEIELLKIAKN
jgi:FKBP-type peptidyl-prolyl cis-trans isomerase FklB